MVFEKLKSAAIYKEWGFPEDEDRSQTRPFRDSTSEKEKEMVVKYFVEPAWLSDVTHDRDSTVLFGRRGFGKTAVRLFIENKSLEEELPGCPIVVPYVDFAHIAETLQVMRQLAHRRQIIRLMLAFGLQHTLRKGGNKLNLEALPKEIVYMFHEYFDSKEDAKNVLNTNGDFLLCPSRSNSEKSVSKLYAQAVKHGFYWYRFRRPRRFMRNLMKNAVPHLLETVRLFKGRKPKLLSDRRRRRELDRHMSDLAFLAGQAGAFGGGSWCVLVDCMDEIAERAPIDRVNDVAEPGKEVPTLTPDEYAAEVSLPFLLDTRVIQYTEGVRFKIFLWRKLIDILREGDARLDKIPSWTLEWSDDQLRQMIDRRLKVTSDDKANKAKVTSLVDLCWRKVPDAQRPSDAKEVGERLYTTAIKLALGSPRDLNKILDAVLSEHASYCQGRNVDPLILTRESSWPGLREVCERLADLEFTESTRRLVIRLGSPFSTKDLREEKGKLEVGDLLAHWLDKGLIRRTPSEGDGTTEYCVIEPRLRWLIDHPEPKDEFDWDTNP